MYSLPLVPVPSSRHHFAIINPFCTSSEPSSWDMPPAYTVTAPSPARSPGQNLDGVLTRAPLISVTPGNPSRIASFTAGGSMRTRSAAVPTELLHSDTEVPTELHSDKSPQVDEHVGQLSPTLLNSTVHTQAPPLPIAPHHPLRTPSGSRIDAFVRCNNHKHNVFRTSTVDTFLYCQITCVCIRGMGELREQGNRGNEENG